MLKRQLRSNVWISAIQHMRKNNKNKEIAQIRYNWANESTFNDKLKSISVACILPMEDTHVEVMATIENPDPIVLDEHYDDLDNWLLTQIQINPSTWDDVQPIRNISYELPVIFDDIEDGFENVDDFDTWTPSTEIK